MFSELVSKYKGFIAYIFFGVCTTVVNVAVYYVCDQALNISTIPSTCIAWLLAVIFAFVTNKFWVFNSLSIEKKVLLHEISSFFGCRLFTGILDVAVMYVAVDLAHSNKLFWKLLSNVVVILVNYAASKLVIFVHDKA